jgi:hypothetical protein
MLIMDFSTDGEINRQFKLSAVVSPVVSGDMPILPYRRSAKDALRVDDHSNSADRFL